MNKSTLKHGHYSSLAESYSQFRPDYADSVLTTLLSLVDKPISEIDAVDVGAGTGIWTRMLADKNLHSVTAIEPNEEMRCFGINDSEQYKINWQDGSGENTGLDDECCDFVSMASSFHWVDFDKGTKEFHRILRPKGRFAALWNPRLLEDSPLLLEIEEHLNSLKSDLKRVSSGRSGITDRLTEMLNTSPYFDDVQYVEGRHIISFSTEQYIGVWRSVNDIQVQLGQKKFQEFLDYLAERLADISNIDATYLTRAWSACRI